MKLGQFENERGQNFELSHLRVVNKVTINNNQRVLTYYVDHQDSATVHASINENATAFFTLPEERSLFVEQLQALVTNAFAN